MDWDNLRFFLELARTGTLTAAARRLAVDHTTVARRLQALTLLTLFLTFDLVMFGAFTRLTDSGLGCPDWPGCYGQASPVGARVQIDAAEAAMPTGPVTHGKAWVEMIHRYLATGVGVLILVLTLATWLTASDGKLTMERRFQLVRERDQATVLRGRWALVCIELASGRARRMPAEFCAVYLPAMAGESVSNS